LRFVSKDMHYNLPLAMLIPPAVLQVLMILVFSHSQRPATLGVTPGRLVGILGGQLFVSSLLGVRTFIYYYFSEPRYLFSLETSGAVIGLLILGYALWRGPKELKLFVVFSVAVLTLGLVRPMAAEPQRLQWEALQVPGCGNRYYFFPMVAFLATLVWMLEVSVSKVARYSAIALLTMLPIGICRDWRYRGFADLHFQEFAAQFERAAPGTEFVIGINPGLNMQLTKKR
jgi:hypothetical protein